MPRLPGPGGKLLTGSSFLLECFGPKPQLTHQETCPCQMTGTVVDEPILACWLRPGVQLGEEWTRAAQNRCYGRKQPVSLPIVARAPLGTRVGPQNTRALDSEPLLGSQTCREERSKAAIQMSPAEGEQPVQKCPLWRLLGLCPTTAGSGGGWQGRAPEETALRGVWASL